MQKSFTKVCFGFTKENINLCEASQSIIKEGVRVISKLLFKQTKNLLILQNICFFPNGILQNHDLQGLLF